MNKEEFLKLKKEILGKIDALEVELENIKGKYIRDNCPIKVGDNVILYGVRGQIVSIKINYDNHFYGKWRKYKKDGTLGVNIFNIYGFDFKYLVKEK